MISHNRADLIGRLTRDPEIRQTSKGIPIAHAGLALNRLRTSGEETTLIEFIARNEHALLRTLTYQAMPHLHARPSTQERWRGPDGTPRTRIVVTTDHISLISHGSLIHSTPIKQPPPQALAN